MQVNFLPLAVAVAPTFVHLAPAFGVAALSGVASVMIRKIVTVAVIHFFTRINHQSFYL
jgi:hypothetical protein